MEKPIYKMGTQKVESNISDAYDAVPSDTIDLATGITKGIWVDVSGTLKVKLASGSDITLASVIAGTWHPMSVIRVYATGTSATGIKAGY